MTKVVIVGAGMAGLSAAVELKRLGVSYQLLEASDAAGGRAATCRLPSDIAADLGAHWLHGKDNPLKALVGQYRLPYREDRARQFRIYRNGQVERSSGTDWLEQAIDQEKAARIEQGAWPDCPISELAADAAGRQTLRDFATMWNGLTPPLEPSAREFLTDKSTPGGIELEGGIGALIEQLLAEAGHEWVMLNTPVSAITGGLGGVRVEACGGRVYEADYAIFTGSLGVLTSGLVAFDPPLSAAMCRELAGLAMGSMNKLIVELDRAFFEERGIPNDLALELLDTDPPHFCHLRGGGAPLISLFVSGPQAARVEGLQPGEALDYVSAVLAPVEELAGFRAHVTHGPVVTRWVGNPYTRGAYSACLPGGRRSGPRLEGNICFCGDTFDEDYPASLAGAYRSGQAAARLLAERGTLLPT